MREANYDENLVGQYELPELLVCNDLSPVITAQNWNTKRRGEILDVFNSEVFGAIPVTPTAFPAEIISEYQDVFSDSAIMQKISLYPLGKRGGVTINLLAFHPINAEGPVPYFLGANFFGNHAVTNDVRVKINQGWMRSSDIEGQVINNRSTEDSRGREVSRWPIEQILRSGFGFATFYYGDVEADHENGWLDGIRGKWVKSSPESWGAISAWAWGFIKIHDYLKSQYSFEVGEVTVIGHSRLGKAAIWAGANDSSFARVIANNAGAGAVSLARRNFGESIEALNERFPHWYCENFKKYNNYPDQLPVDMHQLLALIAPRALYIASASEDLWADPKGELESLKAAQPVFNLLGGSEIGYHLRQGGHDLTYEDWGHYLNFAKSK
jgi:hypothetical protein